MTRGSRATRRSRRPARRSTSAPRPRRTDRRWCSGSMVLRRDFDIFLPFLSCSVPDDDAVPVCRQVEEQRRLGEQREEPAACLIHALADEIRGVRVLERLLVLEGIVLLRKGHRARVVPGVDDLGDAVHDAAACFARQRDLVDERPVQIVVDGQSHVGGAPCAELLIAGVAHPDRERRPPVPAPRQVPVDQALEPVAHPPVTDVRRLPAHAAVVLEETVLDRSGADEPRGDGVVEQRRVAPPAEGICVQDPLRAIETPLLAAGRR